MKYSILKFISRFGMSIFPFLFSFILVSFQSKEARYNFAYVYFRYLPTTSFSESDFENSNNWIRVLSDDPIICSGISNPCTVQINSLDLPVVSGLLDSQLFALRLVLMTTSAPYSCSGTLYTSSNQYVYSQAISMKD